MFAILVHKVKVTEISDYIYGYHFQNQISTMASVSTFQPSLNLEFLCTYWNKCPFEKYESLIAIRGEAPSW